MEICHGAAGLLLVFDAFGRHARLPGTADLCNHLARYIHDRGAAIVEVAGTNPSLLEGSCGVVAALLAYQNEDRTWLAGLSLC